MKRKPYIAGLLAAAMVAGGLSTPALPRIVSSARNFGRYFQAIHRTAASFGPVELFAYSMVLASRQSQGNSK